MLRLSLFGFVCTCVFTLETYAQDSDVFDSATPLQVVSSKGEGGEGPAWDPELGILTSGNGGICRLSIDGIASVYREKAGTNGLLFDREGRLVCCEPVLRRVTRLSRDGKLEVLTDSFSGKKYNQPNDLCLDRQGRIYFSDPRYGPRDDMQLRDADGNTIEGVYRINLDGAVERVLGREVERANGVALSPDDRFLFVADNANDRLGGDRKLWRFELDSQGNVKPKSGKVLFDWGNGRGPDGIKQDQAGRLFVAGGTNVAKPPHEPDAALKGGVYVFDFEGKLLAFQNVPTDEVTNCAFGGDDLRTLYITGGGVLYKTRTKTPGRVYWPHKP